MLILRLTSWGGRGVAVTVMMVFSPVKSPGNDAIIHLNILTRHWLPRMSSLIRHRTILLRYLAAPMLRYVLIVLASLLLMIPTLAPAPPAITTYTVTSTADSGGGSLRQAVLDANADGTDSTIEISQSIVSSPINLSTSELTITAAVTINGNGATINAPSAARVFYINPSVAVTINSMTIAGGSATDGGAIYHAGGAQLAVNNVIFSGNTATDWGGAVFTTTDGTVNITRSTFTGNTAQKGGAVLIGNSGTSGTVNIKQSNFINNSANGGGYGGAIYVANVVDVFIEQSTFSGNTTDGVGGAILNSAGGNLVIKNSTLTGNEADFGGGALASNSIATLIHVSLVENDGHGGEGGGICNSSPGQLTITNSIISGNTNAGGSPEIYNDGGATLTSTSKNIFGINNTLGITVTPAAGTYLIPAAGTTLANIVGSLQDNGGFTQTRLPVFGGLANNTGDYTVASASGLYDQRNRVRIFDGQPDIGAVEFTGLNDTGIQFCGDASDGNNPCLGTEPAGQDAHYGRDAAMPSLFRAGAGSAGFDYTKIANDGSDLAANATLGNNSTDWACTRDNVTGLIWEVKTDDDGLRDQDHIYSWYDSSAPMGNAGTPNGGICYASGSGCDTEKYVNDVNAARLCGFNDWRMPTIKELAGITNLSYVNPPIDPDYFPNTSTVSFWSHSPDANNALNAWLVSSNYGYVTSAPRSGLYYIRLVRGGQ